jgi:hypothetical protein
LLHHKKLLWTYCLPFQPISLLSSLPNNPMLMQQLSQHRIKHYAISRTHLDAGKQSQLAKLDPMKWFLKTF